jgi:hypothetical protein
MHKTWMHCAKIGTPQLIVCHALRLIQYAAFCSIMQLRADVSALHCLQSGQARIIAAERGIQLQGEEPINPDRLLPGGVKCLLLRDWTLSPGVRLRTSSSSSSSSEAGTSSSSSSSSNLNYYVTLRKQPQVCEIPLKILWCSQQCVIMLHDGSLTLALPSSMLAHPHKPCPWDT